MKKTKKLLSILLSLLMIISAIPMTVYANDAVSYIERSWNGSKVVDIAKSVTDYEFVTAETTTFENDNYYVVIGEVTNPNRIVSNGTAHLILTDGCNFDVKNGVNVTSGATINIYGQNDNSGKITASTINDSAIGGDKNNNSGQIVLHGGTYDLSTVNAAAIGSAWYGSIGDINIYNCNITTKTTKLGSGIGSGYKGMAADINIYGGNINAFSTDGASIGSGEDGTVNTINIYGDIINASSVGNGDHGTVDTINIYDGIINTSSVGCGEYGTVDTINIYDGIINTSSVGDRDGLSLGYGYPSSCSMIYLVGGTIISKAANNNSSAIRANTIIFDVDMHAKYGKSENDISGELDFLSEDITSSLSNSKYAYLYKEELNHKPIEYIERNETSSVFKTITNYEFVSISTKKFENNKYYVVATNIDINNRIIVSGTPHLILMDGKTLNVNGGICVNEGNGISIYGQCADSGALNLHCDGFGASLGGNIEISNGSIEIHGGNITAKSHHGAGIGAGYYASASSTSAITVYGGTVNASSYIGAGIGAGMPKIAGDNSLNHKLVAGHGGLIKLYGGNVTAQSTRSSAIGGTNYTIKYVNGSEKTFYGNPATLYVGPSVEVQYGNDVDSTNIFKSTNITQNVGKTVDRYHYVSYSANTSDIIHNFAPATCTEPKTCNACGKTDGNPLGHDFSKQGELLEEATCTNKAIYAVQCVRCDEVNGTMEVGEPLGHTYVTGALISRATCTEPAVYEAKCARCGDISGTKTLGNPLGHNYKIIEKVSGNIYKAKCTTCGDVTNNYQAQSSDYINATDLKKGDIIKAGTIVRVYSYYVDFLVDIDNQAQSVKNNEFIAPTCLKCTNKYVSEKYASAELSFTPACEYAYANCVTPEKCIYCGATTGDIAPDAHSIKLTVEDNVFTYTCSFGCGLSYTVDKSALFASIEKAKNDYVSATYYVSTEALQNTVTIAQDVLDSETATQADVDDAIASIETAITNLNLNRYSVTINKIVDDDVVYTETVKIAYGEMFNYFVELDENQAIYKWVMETDERDVKLNTVAQDFSQVITGNVTFNCYIDNTDTKAEDTARVVFYDKTNRVIKLDYVEVGSSVNMSVEAPKVAFYDFIGWEVISGDPSNVDKSGVSLRATYAPKDIAANKSTIVGLNGVKVNGKTSTTEFYDAKITLTGADSYAYCDAEGNILQGINGNVIYASNNSQTIYVCAGVSNEASTSITGYIDENNKLTINAQYYLPSGSTVVEAGIIAINGDKSSTFKSSQQGSSGEYSISLNYGSASGTLNFKSYLTYKDTDGIHTIYSESQAISFGQNA